MFPKVSTCPMDMEQQIRDFMDDETAEEWAEEYLDKELFLGSYCNGLIWIRELKFYVIFHELIHHFADCLKNKINSEKPDILHNLNEIINSMVQKNYFVFYESIKEIRILFNTCFSS
jgi:hypothetical protein